jgi:hypothetical protein
VTPSGKVRWDSLETGRGLAADQELDAHLGGRALTPAVERRVV